MIYTRVLGNHLLRMRYLITFKVSFPVRFRHEMSRQMNWEGNFAILSILRSLANLYDGEEDVLSNTFYILNEIYIEPLH